MPIRRSVDVSNSPTHLLSIAQSKLPPRAFRDCDVKITMRTDNPHPTPFLSAMAGEAGLNLGHFGYKQCSTRPLEHCCVAARCG